MFLTIISICISAITSQGRSNYGRKYNNYDRTYNNYDRGYSTNDIDNYYDCKDNWENNENYDIVAERIYYIGCVEEEWDYAPSNYDLIHNEKIEANMDSGADEWLYGNGYDRIGQKYIKAKYVEFTDLCFKQRKKIDKRYEHLGAIGPSIRAITGEKIKIYYRNFCSFPNSMHPHGLLYDKASEGAPYNDNSEAGDIVEEGDKWIYIWEARESSVDDGMSSQMWLYHSHVDEVRDVLSGLIGGIIITKKGYETSNDDLMPKDVSREFITFMVMFDENESFYFDENINRYLYQFSGNKEYLKLDENFRESNSMHSINGYLFGNLDSLKCTGNELVRWYTASFGNEKDGPHSPHWHGNILKTSTGQNVDTIVLIPGTTETVTMHVDATGKWLYHCHVFDHVPAGMVTFYTVETETQN